MQIGCTKKLLDTLNQKAAPASETNDFFCWSANLITIKRRKTVVVVNDSNRFGFVLFGLKAKDFAQLERLIADGIRICLARESLSEAAIRAYFEQAGELVVTKTSGRTAVARLNKACERVDLFGDYGDPSGLYQPELSRLINGDLFKPSKIRDYCHPYELLIEDFEDFYGAPVIATQAADLLIKLDLGSTSATRRLLVPLWISFEELHKIIQIAFDWQGLHLHDFKLLDDQGHGVITIISRREEDFDPDTCDSLIMRDNAVAISEFLAKCPRIIYTYDFGDDWNHDITVLDIVSDYDKNYPTCIIAAGNRPPEDVGGIPGYEHYRQVIDNPDHPDYQDLKDWVSGQFYQPCDIERINRRLRHVLKW